jgi:hypothetical protein
MKVKVSLRMAIAVLSLISALGLAASARADSITFTFSGSDTDGPVSGEAAITTSANEVTVTITDLQGNIVSIGQAISGLSFTLTGGSASTATLSSMLGNSITVNGNKSVTSNGASTTGWGLEGSGTTLNLEAAGKGHFGNLSNFEILGAPCAGGTYCDANGSIAGNTAHNSLFNGTVTFVISINGVTSSTGITGADMSFGTGPEITLAGAPTPEPASMVLFGTGLLLLGVKSRRRPKA